MILQTRKCHSLLSCQVWFTLYATYWIYSYIQFSHSFSLDSIDRRIFVDKGISTVSSTGLLSTISFKPSLLSLATGQLEEVATNENDNILALFNRKTVFWETDEKQPSEQSQKISPVPWNKIRYRSSTLGNNHAAPKACNVLFYPEWMEGYWSVNYKFDGASFPQGRNILSLRTAGAGLGTCLSLPNVGYNPPAHSAHFIKISTENIKGNNNSDEMSNSLNIYEDLAYNIPRTLETFWPQSKVISVQTGQTTIESDNVLSLKCFVTGDGCSINENPKLHLPASRVIMDFNAPTRRTGRLTQTCDMSVVDQISKKVGSNIYTTTKSISQYNVNQELQTFYKEIASYEKIDNSNNDSVVMIKGKIRVAAFLPKYIKELDNLGNNNSFNSDYDDNEAVAIYDYKIFMKSIDDNEAANL